MNIQKRINLISENNNLSLSTKTTTAKIEIVGKCTFNCIFCYQQEMKKNNIRQKMMSDDDFELVLKYIKEYPNLKEIGLFYMGESGLHPKLKEYYKKLKELNYFTYLTTNGSCKENIIKAIPYIDSLKVSFNYLLENSDDIKKITQTNIKIDTIIENIKLFSKECKKYNKEFAISTVIDESKYNKEEHKKIIQKIFPEIFHYYIPLQTQGGYNEKGAGGVIGETESKVKMIPCWSLFKGLYIDVDLNIRTCCYGHTEKHILGNIKNEIKNLNFKKELMKKHLNNEIPSVCKECLINK